MLRKQPGWAELGAWRDTSCAQIVKVKQLHARGKKVIFCPRRSCCAQRLHCFAEQQRDKSSFSSAPCALTATTLPVTAEVTHSCRQAHVPAGATCFFKELEHGGQVVPKKSLLLYCVNRQR